MQKVQRIFGTLIHNRLAQILKLRGVSHQRLSQKSGVGLRKIGRIVRGEVQLIDLEALARICIALKLQISDVFVIQLANLWTAAEIKGAVNTHIASRACPQCTATSSCGTHRGGRDSFGRFDNVADNHVYEHVVGLGGVAFKRHLHQNPAGPFGAYGSGVRHWLLDGGFHVIFGSPASNELSEDFVSRVCYDVPVHSPDYNDHFPYNFVWPSRKVNSSFGCAGERQGCGIVDTTTGQLVAQRTFDDDGRTNLDCALIVVYRAKPQRYDPEFPDRDAGVVIMCLGHSGPATYACAQLITDPVHSVELYPTEVGQPIMRVVQAVTLKSSAGVQGSDDRELVKWKLLEDNDFTTPHTYKLTSLASYI